MKKYLNKMLHWGLVIFLVLMLFSVVWGVITRYIFTNQSSWTDEVAIYSLIWVSFLGAAYLSGQNNHITIDVLSASISEKTKIKLDLLVATIISVFVFAVFLIGGSWYVYVTFYLNQTSAALGIKMGLVYLVLPLSGLFIMYFKLYHIRYLYNQLKLI